METVPPTEDIKNSTPLLDDRNRSRFNHNNTRGTTTSPPGGGGLREAVRFLWGASSRRMMREPSMLVRDRAAEQVEERQTDWAYSRPVVFLGIVWNLDFVIVAIAVLISSRNEKPLMPVRLWIMGYGLQRVLHMVFVCMEYRRRHPGYLVDVPDEERGGYGYESIVSSILSSSSREDAREEAEFGGEQHNDDKSSSDSVAKHLESANTMFSFIWWIIGFYWLTAGQADLTRDAPQLCWLCVVFLAFDVFCVALACLIGICMCCCLPCIIAILYAVVEQVDFELLWG